MYSPNNFNRDGLFQKFNGWIESARQKFVEKYNGVKYSEKISKEWKKFDQSFDMVLIHADFFIINIRQMKLLEKKIIRKYEKFKDQTIITEDRLILWSPTLISYLSKISPILSSIIFIQDKMMQLISKKLNKSLPSSMREFIKKGNKNYKIPVKIFYIVRRYWTNSGKSVRTYRDIDQHHFALITHTFLKIKPQYKISTFLPDNPEVKKIEEFTYNKKLDALEFLEKSFFSLHDFIEELASEFGFKEMPYDLQGKEKCDLWFSLKDGSEYWIELKMRPTNYRKKGHAKAITHGINGIIEDINRLKKVRGKKFMMFAIYPIYPENHTLFNNKHLQKISEDIKTPEISLKIGEADFNLYIFEVI